MVREKVLILGAGEQGRETLDIFEACNHRSPRYEVLGFLDDAPGLTGTIIRGLPVLGGTDHLATMRVEDLSVISAIGTPKVRRQVVQRALAHGAVFCNAIHPSAILTPFVQLGRDVTVTAGSILTNNIRIGDHVLVNLGTIIAHDVVVGDFCTLSPGVRISGKVSLGEGCDVGTGSVIIDCVQVGAWSIIGAGAAVTRSLPSNVTAVGVPAKVIKTREPGWQDR
jgi:sugar O-acyltransferase (sialic acid O-acetyltransferase NeuD family)